MFETYIVDRDENIRDVEAHVTFKKGGSAHGGSDEPPWIEATVESATFEDDGLEVPEEYWDQIAEAAEDEYDGTY